MLYVVGVSADREMAVERYDLKAKKWSTLHAVPRQRFGCAAAMVSGAIYVLGGHDGEKAVAESERFDPLRGSGCWEPLPAAPTARHGCAAVAANGKLYLLGGEPHKNRSLATAECYDPTRRAWSELAPVPTGRFGCAAAAAWR
mmetsp:Transcript_102625/g.265354  ORF Transcript_102625/g.265354 Transcript_102625/m.265354 type:complete len:143 (+) Transcript_102625:1-429(+)